MSTPESKRAAPGSSRDSSKMQKQGRFKARAYRDPVAAASSTSAEALRAVRANLEFARTMLDAIELLREAHPDNAPLGAAFALIEPIETMLIDAVQAAERAQPAERPLGFDNGGVHTCRLPGVIDGASSATVDAVRLSGARSSLAQKVAAGAATGGVTLTAEVLGAFQSLLEEVAHHAVEDISTMYAEGVR